ncbi:hypothetical protein PSN45_003946 [Yamadazyma tenuis]|uniref:uncharacterized protein n=1 Tax=Candida tenuis TaxID=2315449 RepID=UPI00279FE9B6|nr:hypothetical protein PSN45_003946 [Yamadazyma tenuis]
MFQSQTVQLVTSYFWKWDEYLAERLASHSFTKNLLVTQSGRYISEFILVFSVLLLSYEITYWTGIYLGWWEYHAKDIFKEIPVHCAHVYVQLNVAKRNNLDKVDHFYNLKFKSKYNILNWKTLSEAKKAAFEREDFIKYHFEFSPEDFEMNDDPEYGSTIDHLRRKILDLFNSSDLYDPYKSEKRERQ